jgi:hypothetical protein
VLHPVAYHSPCSYNASFSLSAPNAFGWIIEYLDVPFTQATIVATVIDVAVFDVILRSWRVGDGHTVKSAITFPACSFTAQFLVESTMRVVDWDTVAARDAVAVMAISNVERESIARIGYEVFHAHSVAPVMVTVSPL